MLDKTKVLVATVVAMANTRTNTPYMHMPCRTLHKTIRLAHVFTRICAYSNLQAILVGPDVSY